jgi:hypothetical protein
MWLKFTNCKYFTGGGARKDAVPKRLRHNQNVRYALPDSIVTTWSDNQLRWYFEQLNGYSILTSKETKVVRLKR